MSIDPNLVPATLDLFHIVLGALVLILVLLTVVLALLPLMAARHKSIEPETVSLPEASATATASSGLAASQPTAALQLLGLLQQEARFIDFVEEDLQGHPDDAIGAAARVVHEGCRKILRQHIQLDRVMAETEGTRVSLDKGFNASEIRMIGNIVGQPPFQGTLIHKGWRVKEIRLPLIAEGHDAKVLAPAEVEL